MRARLRAEIPAHVSSRMRKVRRENTGAEILMQRALTKVGIAFITHAPVLGCKPDLLIERPRVAIFVDGDFWHGKIVINQGKQALRRSLKNTPGAFWFDKIVRNIERDARQTRKLRRHGWSVLRFWASDVLKDSGALASLVLRRVRAKRRATAKIRRGAA